MASPQHLPTTIRTVVQPDPTSPALVLTETPLPALPPGDSDEHLIQVKAASPCLGELTWEVRFPSLFPADGARERVPCSECAGVVVAAPPGSAAFQPGDDVFFRLDAGRRGCLSEYTVAPAAHMARKPASLSWVEAAATPLSALTAWQGLFEHGLLDRRGLGQDGAAAREANRRLRVLVTAAGGSVGSWAVQLAAAAGAGAVVGVCGPAKAADVQRAGASEVVDYTKQTLADWAGQDASRACDMVLDCVGGETLAGCWSAVKDGGVLLSVSDVPDRVKPATTAKQLATSAWFLVQPRAADLALIAAVVDRGQARPWVDSVVEFEDFEAAFERVQGGHARGKVVIKVAD